MISKNLEVKYASKKIVNQIWSKKDTEDDQDNGEVKSLYQQQA